MSKKKPGLILGPLTTQGASGAQFASVPAVVKRNSSISPYCIANEYICYRLAQALCLPTATGVILQDPLNRQPFFVSLEFTAQSASLPPVDPDACVAKLPWLASGLLLFDILVANCDRHRNNLFLDDFACEPTLWIFDHDLALFGFEAGKGYKRLVTLSDNMALVVTGGPYSRDGNRHCLLDRVQSDEHFEEWIQRIEALPDYLIDDACDKASGSGISDGEVMTARAFLKGRRRNLRTLIHQNRGEFKAISTWRLVP